jgi:hypothetical protein
LKNWPLTWLSNENAFAACPASANADFVLFFGAREVIAEPSLYQSLRTNHPNALVLGCSTGTVIEGVDLRDNAATAVAVKLEHSKARLASVRLDGDTPASAGRRLAAQLAAPDLVGVIVLSDGLNINGSELVAGVREVLGHRIALGGGLAGDGASFTKTLVSADAPPAEHVIAALGLYGEKLEVRLGAAHGWDFFGPSRRVTRSKGAVLHELDDNPALDLYERYLGDEAADLPASALLYPLLLTNPSNPADEVVRTVLAVDRDKRTMTFAGDIPEGWSARLMRGDFDNLTQGAADAARLAMGETRAGEGLAVLVSCVGRRLLMGQRAADEVEASAEVLSSQFHQTGFYSYGEIGTCKKGVCGLHNQTMTIVTLREIA